MSGSKSTSGKSPPRSKLTPRCDVFEVSDNFHADRILVYKPIVSSEPKRDLPHLNTKGQAPSGRNVGKLTELLKVPPDVFREVLYQGYTLRMTKSCGDCFKSTSVGYSSPRAHVPRDSGHPNVKKLGPYLDRCEEGT